MYTVFYPVELSTAISMEENLRLWTQNALNALSQAGEEGSLACAWLRQHQPKIGFSKQSLSTGAMWFINGGIYFNPRYFSTGTKPEDPYLLGLLAHETCHLRQGFWTALSVYGELQAWQCGFRVFHTLTGKHPHPAVEALMALPLSWDRDILRESTRLMKAYSGPGYRIDLLPLYPLGQELHWRLTGKSK